MTKIIFKRMGGSHFLPFQAFCFLSTALMVAMLPCLARADGAMPGGLWKTVDGISEKSRALIRITEAHGVLQGRIEEVFSGPAQETNPWCSKCDGAGQGVPLSGREILSGFRKDGDQSTGAEILDPGRTKGYRSEVRLLEDGKKLSVRGYTSLFGRGRSQTWIGQE